MTWKLRRRPRLIGIASQARALRLGGVVSAGAAFLVGALPWLWDRSRFDDFVGLDYRMYRDAAVCWLDGEGYYFAHQIAGPYEIQTGDVLYPPVSLVLFTPFTILADILWWAIPLDVIGWALWRTRPAAWAWIVFGLCVLWPVTIHRVVAGNVVKWIVAGLAFRVAHPGGAILALVKPTLAPFALFGGTDRRWRIGLVGFVVV